MGLDPVQFWNITPRQMALHIEGAVRRSTRRHNELAWLAWHTAAMTRAKKMPTLDKLTKDIKKKKMRLQSWEEQLVIMRGWAASHNAAIAHNAKLTGKRNG